MVTGLSPVVAPLVKVVTPSVSKATLPLPAAFVIDLILPKSRFNLMLTVVLPSSCCTVVNTLVPSKLVASVSVAPPLITTVLPNLFVTGLAPPVASEILAPYFIPPSTTDLRSLTLTAALGLLVDFAAASKRSKNVGDRLSGPTPCA